MNRTKTIAAALIAAAGAAGMLGFAQYSKVKEIGTRTTEKVEDRAKQAATDAPSYEVDASHSSVVFKIQHAGVSNFYGRFTDIDGAWTFDPADPSTARFNFSVPTRSVETDNNRRNEHLKSGDFFNAAQFREITFESTSVKQVSGDMYEMTGNLTLMGETRKITAELQWLGTGEMRGATLGGFEARFSIDRTDYGMDFMVGPLGRDVDLIVALEGRQQ